VVATGAVYVGESAVRLDSDPSAGAVQVTPELVLSFVKVAVKVAVSFPSTVVDDEVTETPITGIGLMVKLSVAIAVSAVGDPESVIVKISEVDGVAVVAPATAEITPVPEFKVIPVGSVPPVSFQV
jgi:hypothetical protein